MTKLANPAVALAPPPARTAGRRAGFVVVCLGQLVMFVNITQITTVLAPIQQDLGLSGSALVWVASIYSMVLASLVLSAGTVGDIIGRRRTFAAGAALLAAGSLSVFLSSGATGVILGQAVMGVGGAMVLPNSLALVTHAFPDPHRRTSAVGIWVAVSGVGLAVGPLAAGLILQHHSWHAVFLVDVVLGAAVLLLTPFLVTESRSPGRHLDPPGLVLAVVAIGALNYTVIEGGHGGYGQPKALGAALLAAAALAAFIAVEIRTRTPMLNLRLFAVRSFSAANLIAFIAQYGFVAVAFVQVLYFERVRHESILATGVLMLWLMASYVLASPLSSRAVRRFGFRATLAAGALLAAAGTLLMTGQSATTPTLVVGGWMALFGTGAGLLLPPSTAAAVVSVPHSDGGMAGGTVNLFRQVGGTLGSSITGTVLTGGAAAGSFAGALHTAVLIPAVGALAAAATALLFVRNRPAGG
ncbi:MFS transporter [Kitasatospora sp. NPDC048540]|uniref:MFS transporter n=1 Tax=unclassified Kitasatospora TaxID=2633591 RepID=UPI00053A734D|nr:MFS transporter [Kitasatospora sp. MBT63]